MRGKRAEFDTKLKGFDFVEWARGGTRRETFLPPFSKLTIQYHSLVYGLWVLWLAITLNLREASPHNYWGTLKHSVTPPTGQRPETVVFNLKPWLSPKFGTGPHQVLGLQFKWSWRLSKECPLAQNWYNPRNYMQHTDDLLGSPLGWRLSEHLLVIGWGLGDQRGRIWRCHHFLWQGVWLLATSCGTWNSAAWTIIHCP